MRMGFPGRVKLTITGGPPVIPPPPAPPPIIGRGGGPPGQFGGGGEPPRIADGGFPGGPKPSTCRKASRISASMP